MLVYLFIIASASLALPVTNAAFNCSVCALENSYTESNGYGCFEFNNGDVACTCPDQRYTMNKACRICERENICGDNSKTRCTETSIQSLGVHSDIKRYFACFCADSSFVVGGACPSTPATTTTDFETTAAMTDA